MAEQPNQPMSNASFDAKDVADNKVIAALSYLGILVLVPLLVRKESKFAQAHAKQGLVTLLFLVILGWIPLIGWIFAAVIIVCNLIALINALMGKFWQIPGAYALSQKFKF